MGLGLDQLVFDPTVPGAGANVGAFVTASDGTLITHTTISGKQALDVNVANTTPIPVTSASDVTPATQNITAQDVGSVVTTGANGQSIVTGTPTAGSVASFTFSTETTVRVQVTNTWTGTVQSEISMDAGVTWYPVNIMQNLITLSPTFTANFEGVTSVAATTQFRMRATAAWTGTATVGIVESVNHAFTYIGNTSLSVTQGTSPWVTNLSQVGGSAITLGQKTSANSFPVVIASDQSAISVVGNVADDAVDSGNPIKSGTRAAFGSPLSAISTTGDRADMLSDRYRRLFVTGSADVAVKNTAVSVGVTAQALLGSQLAGRRKIYIQNNTTKKSIYLGFDATVTVNNGLKVAAGGFFEDEIGEDVSIWVISDTATTDIRVYELA